MTSTYRRISKHLQRDDSLEKLHKKVFEERRKAFLVYIDFANHFCKYDLISSWMGERIDFIDFILFEYTKSSPGFSQLQTTAVHDSWQKSLIN